uniref:ATP synthase F0 subunit 8 n=1 Tax=Xenoturbella monstrosa TaxID=1755483 RepID=A0A0U2W415_9BILA|nr:ATP synthase F0 subunit 8 [Xenoturbella monstrosa]ALS20086.1 ATP synthase F0 subunit 8 [Xenoturbella monstrosa]
MPQLKFQIWMTMFITTWTFMTVTALTYFNNTPIELKQNQDEKTTMTKKWQNTF